MRRAAQPLLSADGQLALEQYMQVLQPLEDLSPVTTRNYLSDLRQFIAWCECSWRDGEEDRFFRWSHLLLPERDAVRSTQPGILDERQYAGLCGLCVSTQSSYVSTTSIYKYKVPRL